ncbi:hypothetical protein M405DRAFT_811661 [Rhizopogon salebrosus TDB-379]|nr:hypothetical protein M405DRAFT_811661 [Rhizopogon salebrosus TDB-379]
MCWGIHSTKTSAFDMHWRHVLLDAADPPLIDKDLNGDITIDMHWGSTNSTATSTIDMHWGDRPKLGAAVPVAAADAPLIDDDINVDNNMHWGPTEPQIIDMHWGDQPKRQAAVPTNVPFIYKDLKESINMHWQ